VALRPNAGHGLLILEVLFEVPVLKFPILRDKFNGSCMTSHTASLIALYAVAVYLNKPVQCNVHLFSS